MDATKELISKVFMCFRCTFKALGVKLWHFKVVQMNQFFFFWYSGVILRALARWRPLNQKACFNILGRFGWLIGNP
jgi:hypothetical protein